jgi:predicted dehydrogenase
MSRKIRVAVIGLGMGQNHAADYSACKDAELVAVCDIDPVRLKEQSAKRPGVKTYTDYREMLDKEKLDGVSVAVPNDLHRPITCEALSRGLHVLCEKPMALNAGEAKAMRDLARRKHLKLMINFAYRWVPQARVLKGFVDAGELGEIYYGRTRWMRSRGAPDLGTWFTDKSRSGGGPLIDLGVHRIDFALWLMGFPEVSTVTGSAYYHLAREAARVQKKKCDIEDLAAAFIRFKNGATLVVEASWDMHGERFEDQLTELYGTKGGIVQRNVGEGCGAYSVSAYEMKLFKDLHGRLVEVTPKIRPQPGETSCAHFVDCIVHDREPAASADHGVYVMKILDAIYESAATGREVKVE